MESDDTAEVEESKEVKEKETKTVDTVSEANSDDSESKPEVAEEENGSDCNQSIFAYEQLRAKSQNPVTGIDFKRREVSSIHHFYYLNSQVRIVLMKNHGSSFLLFLPRYTSVSKAYAY